MHKYEFFSCEDSSDKQCVDKQLPTFDGNLRNKISTIINLFAFL